MTATLDRLSQRFGDDIRLTFHLSPGTPAMAAVWILVAKTRHGAELIESSKKHGVHTASVPFDISADFLPDLLARPDRELERLSIGLPPDAPEFSSILHRSPVMQRVIARARRVLGWQPTIRLSDGLQRTVEFYRTYREHYWE